MFKLINHFIKQTLVAFYKEEHNYIVQKKIVKNNKILSSENFKFTKEEFISFINSCFIGNTQTYISTIIETFNQGCVDSCNHSKYKALDINIDNIKILCLKDYSIFIGLYELNNFIKENKEFNIDYIFSPYLLIDMNKKNTKNSIYMFITKNFVVLVIYEDANKPKYSNIYQFKLDESSEDLESQIEDNDTIDDSLDDIDLVDDIEELDDLEDLDEDIDNVENIDEEIENIDTHMDDSSDDINEIIDVKTEIETMDFIKNSIKDYYESYSDNFLEKGYVFYNDTISDKFISNIKNETFLDIQSQQIDILSVINDIALKEINV